MPIPRIVFAVFTAVEVAGGVLALVSLSPAHPRPGLDTNALSALVAESTRYLNAGSSLEKLIEADARDPGGAAIGSGTSSRKRQNGAG